jgi:hypothetical protein
MAGIDGGRVMAESDTAADGLERKLVTILSADVAAYSRLMAEDFSRPQGSLREAGAATSWPRLQYRW